MSNIMEKLNNGECPTCGYTIKQESGVHAMGEHFGKPYTIHEDAYICKHCDFYAIKAGDALYIENEGRVKNV